MQNHNTIANFREKVKGSAQAFAAFCPSTEMRDPERKRSGGNGSTTGERIGLV